MVNPYTAPCLWEEVQKERGLFRRPRTGFGGLQNGRLLPSQSRRKHPLWCRRRAARNLPGQAAPPRPPGAAVRRTRAALVPRVRCTGPRLLAGALRQLRRGPRCSVLLQRSRVLQLLRRAPDGGHRRASGRSCAAPVPIRQWVLSLPFALRYRLAYDARLVRDVLQIFISAVFRSLRPAGSRRQWSPGGAVRRGHLRAALRGRPQSERPLPYAGARRRLCHRRGRERRFHALPPPGDAEVTRVTGRVARRIARVARAARARAPGPIPTKRTRCGAISRSWPSSTALR